MKAEEVGKGSRVLYGLLSEAEPLDTLKEGEVTILKKEGEVDPGIENAQRPKLLGPPEDTVKQHRTVILNVKFESDVVQVEAKDNDCEIANQAWRPVRPQCQGIVNDEALERETVGNEDCYRSWRVIRVVLIFPELLEREIIQDNILELSSSCERRGFVLQWRGEKERVNTFEVDRFYVMKHGKNRVELVMYFEKESIGPRQWISTAILESTTRNAVKIFV